MNQKFKNKIWLYVLRIYFHLKDLLDFVFLVRGSILLDQPHPKKWFDFRHEMLVQNISKHDRIVDLGCGIGKVVKHVNDQQGFAVGMDWKKHPLSVIHEPSFIKGDILQYPLSDLVQSLSINTAVLSHILEHIEHPVAYLKKIKNAGVQKIIICVPSSDNWRFQTKQSIGLNPLTDSTHFREYTQLMLRSEIEEAGYRINMITFNSEGELFAIATL